MLFDGIQLLDSSSATNFTIESGSTLPVSGNNLGELFYKTGDGIYVYDGATWTAIGGGGNSNSLVGTSTFGAYNATTGVYAGVAGATEPWVTFTNMAGTTDSKIALLHVSSSGNFIGEFVNDAGSASTPWLTVTRSATTATNFTVTSSAITLNGAVTGTSFSGSGASLTSLNGSNISSGTVGTARLGSGTANSTTYLRGDGTWATAASAGSAMTATYIGYGNGSGVLTGTSNFTFTTGSNTLELGSDSSRPVTVRARTATTGSTSAGKPDLNLIAGNGLSGSSHAGDLNLRSGSAASVTDGIITFTTGASGVFAERLRITSTGAWGLTGANYGTAGQVLTSNGSSGAPTWSTVSAAGASVSANNTWTAAQRGSVSALTYGATVTPNFDASNNFSLSLTGNATVANPTGTITPGQSGIIAISQDATGSRTVAWGTYFKAAGGVKPTLSTAPNAVDLISYYVVSPTMIFISGNLAIA